MGRRWPSRPPHGCGGHPWSSWHPATLGCGLRSPQYSATLGRGGALSSSLVPPLPPPVHPPHVATLGNRRRSCRARPAIVHWAGMRVTTPQRLWLAVSGFCRVVAAKENSHLAEGRGRSLARYGSSRLGNFVVGGKGRSSSEETRPPLACFPARVGRNRTVIVPLGGYENDGKIVSNKEVLRSEYVNGKKTSVVNRC